MENVATTYEEDLLRVIDDAVCPITETSIHRSLFPKYGFQTCMFFNDAIRTLEFQGKIIRMNKDGIVWWELSGD